MAGGITYAARTWTQVHADDFERVGVAYDLCHGNPLLGDDPEVADVFFAEDGSLWFLRRADGERVSSTWMGTMGPMPT